MMRANVGASVYTVDNVDTRATSDRYKQNKDQKQSIPQTGRADKAAPKGKKKKNRSTGKRVAVNDNGSRRESEEEEEEVSKEESPKKPAHRTETIRSARLNFVQPPYRNLNEQLSNLS